MTFCCYSKPLNSILFEGFSSIKISLDNMAPEKSFLVALFAILTIALKHIEAKFDKIGTFHSFCQN